jgi:hypothetical protein
MMQPTRIVESPEKGIYYWQAVPPELSQHDLLALYVMLRQKSHEYAIDSADFAIAMKGMAHFRSLMPLCHSSTA